MYFEGDQPARLAALARQFEKRTGARLTAAVVDRSDSHPEIPWKAFALVVCLHAFIHLAQALLQPDRLSVWSLQHSLGFILGTSAAVALLAHAWGPFGRLFLDNFQAARQAHQYAAEVFLEQELYRTPARNAILMLVSLYERQVALLPDIGSAARLDPQTLKKVRDAMLPLLRREDRFQAIQLGIERLADVWPDGPRQPAAAAEVPVTQPLIELKCSDI